MSTLARGRRISTFAAADDAALFAAVAALSAEALQETYDRHVVAPCSLALLIAEDSERVEDAVAGAFIALWRAPTSICQEEQSLRAALAGEVYTRCAQARQTPAPEQRMKADDPPSPAWVDFAILSRSQRDLLALILLGKHNPSPGRSQVRHKRGHRGEDDQNALHTVRHCKGKPRLFVVAATGRAGAPASSRAPRRSTILRRGSVS